MLKILRIWSLAVLSILGTYIALVLLMSAIAWSSFVSTLTDLLGVTSIFLGFVSFTPEQFRCFEQDGLLGTGCLDEVTTSIELELQGARWVTLGYLVLTLIAAAVVYLAATRLERAQTNALVIAKLQQADDTYIRQILAISDFDKATMGIRTDGVEYTQSVLAREASGGHGDAQYSRSDEAELEEAASGFTRKVERYGRWAPMYEKFSEPTFRGIVQVVLRVWLLIFVISAVWFATFSSAHWSIALLVALAVVSLVYLPNQRWKSTYFQFSGSNTYLLTAVLSTAVLCAINYLFLLLVGMIFGNRVFLLDWLPTLSVFLWIAAAITVLLPLSNYVAFRRNANANADRKIEQFFRTLLDAGVKGTHVFAVCDSCMTPTILFLGQTHDCNACERRVDSSMKVRTARV